MKTTKSLVGVGLAVLLALFAGAAYADPITVDGVVYTLIYDPNPVSTTATTETFRITYIADTSGYDQGDAFLTAISFKVASTAALEELGTVLVSASAAEFADESVVFGPTAANGCQASGGGWVCLEDTNDGGVPVPNGTLTFVFDVEVNTGTLFTGTNEASIKALFLDADGRVNSQVSENITLQVSQVQEPGTLALLGSGLAGLGFWGRRRLFRRRV